MTILLLGNKLFYTVEDGCSMMVSKSSIPRNLIFAIIAIAAISIIGMVVPGAANAITLFVGGPPDPPGNLTATAVSSKRIDLQWEDKSNNEINFIIERKSSQTTYIQVNQVGSSATSFSDFNLVPDTTYYYRLKAHGTAGDSTYSNEAFATTLGPPVQAPILLWPSYSALVSTLTPRMKWVPSKGTNITYSIQIATDYDFSNIVLSRAGITNPYYDVPEYVLNWNFSYYYWRVSAQSGFGGSSPWSYRWYFRALPQPFDRQNSCGCG